MQHTNILDKLIPLRGASHVDVVEYRVDIPVRYAECHAVLADGSKARFMNPRKFLGWSSYDAQRSLLFRDEDTTIEVEVDNHAAENQCSPVRSVNLLAAMSEGADRARKFIGIDGNLLTLPVV